jgi:uncharacterized membrane protein
MDLYAAVKLYQNNKESFGDSPSTQNNSVIQSRVRIVSALVSISISLYAVYLSWSCNTSLGINTGLKILYAFFAFIFGLLYLLFYLIFRIGQCQKITIIKSVPGGRK